MEALSWIGEFLHWLASLVPRLRIIRSTHAGVRFRHGKRATPIQPGLCVYWPIVTELEVVPVARQTLNLPAQSLTTRDGVKVVVSGVVVYAIRDVVAALAKNWDVDDTIQDVSLCAVANVITSHDYSYLLANLTGLVQSELTQATRRKLKVYGVRVYRTALTDFSTAIVIKKY